MGDNEFIQLIVFVGKCFREVLRATLDIFCALLLLASLAAPWNIPSMCEAFSEADSRGDYEALAFSQFGQSLIDLLIM